MGSDLPLPRHSLPLDEPPIIVEKIAYANPYDFTQRHRHDYYEVLFFVKGGGSQLIDFMEYPVLDNSCYIIQPNQVHLLKRDPVSRGRLLQFRSESIESSRLHRLLQERIWQGRGAIIFEQCPKLIAEVEDYVNLISHNEETTYRYRRYIKHHLLQALLHSLLSVQQYDESSSLPDKDFASFLDMLEAGYRQEHSVRYYIDNLQISERKLGALSKKHLGLSPLQAIHSRLLLEAKRLLTFGEQSHKEIALDLGFDNPAAFSAFIKKKTGRTASELQTDVTEIHRS